MISWTDFQEYKAACKDSPRELTEFLSAGRFMHQFNIFDFWNAFTFFLNSDEVDVYGLFDDSTLIGFGTMTYSEMTFGCQITYWIRNGYHGKGLGKLLLYYLLRRALGPKKFLFAEMIIDQENKASLAIVDSLGITRIKSWEDKEVTGGVKNSGKFHLYMAFEHRLELDAEELGITPLEALVELWTLEKLGAIHAIPHDQLPKLPRKISMRENLKWAKRPRL